MHSTFDTPDRLFRQVIELPDGRRYFRSRRWFGVPSRRTRSRNRALRLASGCEIRYASRLVYAGGIDLDKAEGTPIGVNCRLCERENCPNAPSPRSRAA